ncbi:PepSY domain-containing protein [Pedobacter sp. AW1-32]|uniref:PepSY domain-containing protein n=1 Tax=Pedobacter sp. AW1-32 TaxID=3383026 RepID=UPI003FEFB227
MTISFWRYSHLALAVSSFLFIALASVTGIILSFKPITEKTRPYKAEHFSEIRLAQVLPVIQKNYSDISELAVDANQFVKVNGTDSTDASGNFYVNPITGKGLGKVEKESEFFQWMTTLHRSLFLHELGRLFVGITAFLLFLVSVSGTVLIIQRQRSLKRFFAKIVRDNFAQYYHVVLGRLLLIPILIITLSGTYMSLSRFGLIKEEKITHKIDFDALKTAPQKKLSDFDIFKNTALADVQSIEFPFSEDVEDYYTLKLKDRELTVNQITGDILTEKKYAMSTMLSNLSMDLHTGRSHMIWAIVLALASVNILFFIYSGFAMTLKRRANRVKNKFKSDQAEYIILVGSENGTTFRFAKAIHQQLLKAGKKVFLSELNAYKEYPKAKQMLVFTATYGIGDAPTNSTKFFDLLEKFPQKNNIKFSVVAFGSHTYPDFCKFGYEINNLLSKQVWAKPLTEIHTVNDRSPEEFTHWANVWSQAADISISLLSQLLETKPVKTQKFVVASKIVAGETEKSFMIALKPVRRHKFSSGDLLGIYPANDYRERLYSIGKVNGNVHLSVKLHQNGLGSGFLYNLNVGDSIAATVIQNEHFHFPAKAKTVILISNGTGIAPFLGMIGENESMAKCHLYCGFRSETSVSLYNEQLQSALQNQKLTKLNVALSREGGKQYVKDLLERDSDFVIRTLENGGTLMLCGSLSMQNDVMKWLDARTQSQNGKSLSYYQSHGQILMDCY